MTNVRRNLVIVRAGRASLHPRWLSDTRTWDLIVSCYDPEAAFTHGAEVPVVLREGGKWDGLFALLDGSDLMARYDYVWVPDDDIDALFAAVRAHALDVAQPALARDNYYMHFLFNACPVFALRYTTAVEIIVPCVRSGVLAVIHGEFRDTMSGFGLDHIWCRLGPDPDRRAAMIDMIAVGHTRPVGRTLRKAMTDRGLTPATERARLCARSAFPSSRRRSSMRRSITRAG